MENENTAKSCLQTLLSGDYTRINEQPILDQCKQLFTKLSESEFLEEAFLDVVQAFNKMWNLKNEKTLDFSNKTVAAQVFLELTRVIVKLCEGSQKFANEIFNYGIIYNIAKDLNEWLTNFNSKHFEDKSTILYLTLNYFRIIALIARFEELNYSVACQARGINLPGIIQTFLENWCELNFICALVPFLAPVHQKKSNFKVKVIFDYILIKISKFSNC